MPTITSEHLIAAALVLAATIIIVRKAVTRRRGAQTDSGTAEALEKEAAQKVRAGTHDAQGHRLCITCSDKMTRATQPPFLVELDTGLWDLVRRAFGAPERYKLARAASAEPVYCDMCADIVEAKHRARLLKYEQRVRDAHASAALELRRWLRNGCNDAVAAEIEKHDAQQRELEPQQRRATVVQLPTDSAGT
jgi:hypothetical protein